MKVSVIGCSTAWTDRPCSSYCINDTILVDCGEGTFKYYAQAQVDYKKIKHIFITHFHSDHTFNLSQFYARYSQYEPKKNQKTVTIYGPKGLSDNLELIRKSAFEDNYRFEDFFNLVEIDDFDKKIIIDDIEISAFQFQHGNIEDIAYIFDDGATQVGFSGDLAYNDKINIFISKCKAVFLECCALKSTQSHLGYDKYIKLQNKHKNTKFLAIHCEDAVYSQEKDLNIECAKHSKTYNF